MHRLPRAALAAACALALVACGEEDDPAASAPTATPTPAATQAAGGCRKVAEPKAKPDGDLERPRLKLDAAKAYAATVKTSCGDFTIALDAEQAPKTSASFVSLARDGFFADTVFHRIVPGFVIQGGDPTGTGTGGPGYSVEEAPPADVAYTKGVVAMAKTAAEAPGTSGSQFYVVTGEDAGLPAEYALLGKVTEGLDVVEAIGAVATDASERPTSPVVIESVEVTEG